MPSRYDSIAIHGVAVDLVQLVVQVCIRLKRRKNRPNGSGIMKRCCTCRGCRETCVVHELWAKVFEHLPDGAHPWVDITPEFARSKLRAMLERLLVPDASAYGTHDLRQFVAIGVVRCP